MVDMPDDKLLKHFEHKQVFLKVLSAVIILVSGIIIGWGGTVLLVKNNIILIDHNRKTPADITKLITEKYGLNQEQTKRVEEIIDRAFEQRKSDNDEMNQKRDAYMQIIITQMKDVLTPQQFERWNKDFQDLREKFKNRRK